MQLLIFLLATAAVPHGAVHVVRVDLVEVNHFHDDQARLVFSQLIFRDWNQTKERFDIRDWRLIKRQCQRPRHDEARREWSTMLVEGEHLLEVKAADLVETWTQHDPELVERDKLPKEKRKGLKR